MRGARPGAVLLEVIAALAILATAGVATLTLAGQSIRSATHALDADRALREASAFLDAVSLWTRDDLDRRLGERPQGAWRLRIDRPSATLYTIVLTDSATRVEILRTSVHRRRPASAAPATGDGHAF